MTPPQQVTIDISKEKKGKRGKGKKTCEDKRLGRIWFVKSFYGIKRDMWMWVKVLEDSHI